LEVVTMTTTYFAIGLLQDEVNRGRDADGLPPIVISDPGLPEAWRPESEARYGAAFLLARWGFIDGAEGWPPSWEKPVPPTPEEKRALLAIGFLRKRGLLGLPSGS